MKFNTNAISKFISERSIALFFVAAVMLVNCTMFVSLVTKDFGMVERFATWLMSFKYDKASMIGAVLFIQLLTMVPFALFVAFVADKISIRIVWFSLIPAVYLVSFFSLIVPAVYYFEKFSALGMTDVQGEAAFAQACWFALATTAGFIAVYWKKFKSAKQETTEQITFVV